MAEIENAGFRFYSDFDSANLAKVEFIPHTDSIVTAANNSANGKALELPDIEFNLWTRPDCAGTEFVNGNRTWFYFGIQANNGGLLVKLNLVDINRQSKMYGQGMCPVYRVLPGKTHWERVRDRPTFTVEDNIFVLTFKYKTPENCQSVTYFAFTYPYSYMELQSSLRISDTRFLTAMSDCVASSNDEIYYVRECICHSLEGRRVDLITISSFHGVTSERELRLKNLFPEDNVKRPFVFTGKKVVFVSARVHPGETPSSFVFNGFLQLLLNRDDPIAITLRRTYVFKLIPFLNPDGVVKGHYRTDTRGVNLNRMYLNPDLKLHPSIYAARAVLRYHHFGYEKEEEVTNASPDFNVNYLEGTSSSEDLGNLSFSPSPPNDSKLTKRVSHMTLEERKQNSKNVSANRLWCCDCKKNADCKKCLRILGVGNADVVAEAIEEPGVGDPPLQQVKKKPLVGAVQQDSLGDDSSCTACGDSNSNNSTSGLFLYMDLHGHASKKGIFMYGNHFKDVEKNVECMLLPKLMSLNNHNFHFTNCNFTERNMYLKDRRDGMSREGSGRVSVLKMTGLIRSYTLECNYNTGRIVNVLPSTVKENPKTVHTVHVPPKYNPQVFEEVGKAMGGSILDLTGSNPLTRLPNSEFRSLDGLKDWLRVHLKNETGFGRLPKITSIAANAQNSSNPNAQGSNNRKKIKAARTVISASTQRSKTVRTSLSNSKCFPHNHHHPNNNNTSTSAGSNTNNNKRTSVVTAPHLHKSSRSAPAADREIVHHKENQILGIMPLGPQQNVALSAPGTSSSAPVNKSVLKSIKNAKINSGRVSDAFGTPKRFQQGAAAQGGALALRGRNLPLRETAASKTGPGKDMSGSKKDKFADNRPAKVSTGTQSEMSSTKSTPRAMKLQEICLVKSNGGKSKKLVAKYLYESSPSSNLGSGGGVGSNSKPENLVVAWNGPNAAPQVFSEKIQCDFNVASTSGAAGTPNASGKGGEDSQTSSASTRVRYSGYRVAKFSGFKHKRLKINKPLTGNANGKIKADKFKSRKKMRPKLI